MKSAMFFDAGNVFSSNCPDISTYCLDVKDGELRYSAGVSVTGSQALHQSASRFPIR